MFISPSDTKLIYKYISPVMSMNLSVNFKELNFNCTMVTIEGAFIGKYFLILKEDDNSLELIQTGKGNFYGSFTEESALNPVLRINKKHLGTDYTLEFEGYEIKMYNGFYKLATHEKTYENCFKLEVKYKRRQYIVYIEDGKGIISIKNLINGRIKDEIIIKE